MIPGKQYRPEDLFVIAWRRKWVIVAPFLVIGVAVAAWTRVLPDLYRSETLILVVPQRVPESYVRSTITARIEDRLQTIRQQILSRPRLEQIILDFDLYAEERKTQVMEDVVARMRGEIETPIVKGDAFSIGYVAKEPRTAMRVVERLASLFIDENLRDREVLAEGTNQFLEAQLGDAKRRLVEHERKLSDYQRAHADDLPSQLNFNQQAQHNAEMQIQAVVNSLNLDRERQVLLERQLADAADADAIESVDAVQAAGGDVRAEGGALEQLVAARAVLSALEARLTPQHPDVVRQKRLIADLEGQSVAQTPSVPGRPAPAKTAGQAARASRNAELRRDLANLSRQIAAKEEQELKLRASVEVYQSRIHVVPVRQSEMTELNRDYETIQALYRSLLEKHESSKISANLEQRQQSEQFKVIEPARAPERPFSPDRLRFNLLGAMFGLAVGLGIAAVLEYFDTRMRTEDDVLLALGLPVLALVPHVVAEEERRGHRGRRLVGRLTGNTTGLGLLAWAIWISRA